jgi:alpha-tubulin suppressor-like RCC1 family protein
VNCDSIATNPAPCSSLVPFPVAGGLQFLTVSIGTTHVCGVTLSSTAYCWGTNDHGQLGDGTTQSSAVPIAVSGALVPLRGTSMQHFAPLDWSVRLRGANPNDAPRTPQLAHV